MKYTPVTIPFLPPLEEYVEGLNSIWSSRQLTNGGKFHEDLSERLRSYFGIPGVSLYSNATLALIALLKSSVSPGKKIITTPFTFAATAQAIMWADCTPLFVDIDPNTLNIDPALILKAMNDDVGAVLAVHVYGNLLQRPDLPENIKFFVDAAHSFSGHHDVLAALNAADASVLSFHATKVFSTVEGGSIISNDLELISKLDKFRNFGFESSGDSVMPGFNAKMSEFHALMGCLQLPYIENILAVRRSISERYIKNLSHIGSLRLINKYNRNNCSYFPVIVEDSFPIRRDDLCDILFENGILARKYFFPLASDLSSISGGSEIFGELSNSRFVSDRILCLPISSELDFDVVDDICGIINDASTFPHRGKCCG